MTTQRDCCHLWRCPPEILEHIFGGLDEAKDLCAVAMTSVGFKDLVYAQNNLWKSLFEKKYPGLLAGEQKTKTSKTNYRAQFRRRVECRRQCRAALESISGVHFTEDHLPYAAYAGLQDLAEEFGLAMVHDSLTQPFRDHLTVDYYREKSEIHFNRIRLR